MGIYCYTLRKATIQVGDMTIGRTAYAFKDGWGASESARAKRLYAAAERARAANPDLEYVIMGDFNDARVEPTPVFKVSKQLDSFFDSRAPGELVGHLSKVGRRFVFEPVKEPVDA